MVIVALAITYVCQLKELFVSKQFCTRHCWLPADMSLVTENTLLRATKLGKEYGDDGVRFHTVVSSQLSVASSQLSVASSQ